MDEEDKARLLLIGRALDLGEVTFEVFPGYESPTDYHAYVIAPSISENPLFACVLAQFEHDGPDMQIIENVGYIVWGLKSWIKRIWPEKILTEIKVTVKSP